MAPLYLLEVSSFDGCAPFRWRCAHHRDRGFCALAPGGSIWTPRLLL